MYSSSTILLSLSSYPLSPSEVSGCVLLMCSCLTLLLFATSLYRRSVDGALATSLYLAMKANARSLSGASVRIHSLRDAPPFAYDPMKYEDSDDHDLHERHWFYLDFTVYPQNGRYWDPTGLSIANPECRSYPDLNAPGGVYAIKAWEDGRFIDYEACYLQGSLRLQLHLGLRTRLSHAQLCYYGERLDIELTFPKQEQGYISQQTL